VTTISTGSRLHFGLLNAGGVAGQPHFGGLGLMIDSPRVKVSVREFDTWLADGPECERATTAARKVAQHAGTHLGFAVHVEACPPLHSGLGVGTQLALAAGRAMAEQLGIGMNHEDLVRVVGRGRRSGIGARGFHSGGFILDHGHAENELSHTERIEWPEDWCILLVQPSLDPIWHGPAELQSFARPRDPAESVSIEMQLRILASDVTDALRRQDFEAFSECLYRYNRLAGKAFAEDQGGNYSSNTVEEIVQWFRAGGLRGVGQSSWGPTVFAIVDRKYAVGWWDSAAKHFLGKADVTITDGARSGFRMEMP
jgi:beta-ribofuranosylaminobenzene 5'-phosphate synthase